MSTEDENVEATDAVPTTPQHEDRTLADRSVRATSRARRIGGRPSPAGSSSASAEHTGTDVDQTVPRPGKSATRVVADRQASTLAETAAPTIDLTKAPTRRQKKVAAARTKSPTSRGPAKTGSRRLWLSWTAAGVAVAAALVLLVFSVTSSHRVWWGKSSPNVTADRTEVLAAAKSCIAKLNTYDYRTLGTAETTGLGCTTGAFTAQYRQAFETQIKVLAPQVKATQTFQVNDAGIERVSSDRTQWDVLVFGQISTTNSTTAANTPTQTPLSAVVHMQRVGGNWLIAGYDIAPRS